MIENWLKNDIISDTNCNGVVYNAPIRSKGMTNNASFTFSASDTTRAIYNQY